MLSGMVQRMLLSTVSTAVLRSNSSKTKHSPHIRRHHYVRLCILNHCAELSYSLCKKDVELGGSQINQRDELTDGSLISLWGTSSKSNVYWRSGRLAWGGNTALGSKAEDTFSAERWFKREWKLFTPFLGRESKWKARLNRTHLWSLTCSSSEQITTMSLDIRCDLTKISIKAARNVSKY